MAMRTLACECCSLRLVQDDEDYAWKSQTQTEGGALHSKRDSIKDIEHDLRDL